MEELLGRIGEAVANAGAWAPFFALLFTTTVAVFPVPAELPAALNGLLFGPLLGTGLTWTGAMLGACVSFEVARKWGQPAARRLLPASWAERAVALGNDRRAASGLLILRLVPVVAFTLLNWGAGLTDVRRSTFLWTTAVGILPGVVLFTGGGAAAVDLLRGMTPPSDLLGAMGVAAAILMTVYLRYRRVG